MTPDTRTIVFTNAAESAERHAAWLRRAALTGCPWHDVKSMLRDVGLRPTRQRMALGWILFAKGDRHLTAEMLYEEATKAKVPVSLATVYNTLHQFTDVGLLRQVAVDGSKTYFDTNISAASPLLRRGRQRAGRHSRRRRGGRQDAGTARGLRDRPHRRGGPAAPQGTLSGSLQLGRPGAEFGRPVEHVRCRRFRHFRSKRDRIGCAP